MSDTLLTIDYRGLSLWQGAKCIYSSPAYALVEGKSALFGESARAQAKLKPTVTENEFWDRFSEDRLARRNRVASTQADLAYLHLQDFWQAADSDESITLIAPADYSREQISLLLGVVHSLNIPVAAVSNAAVVAYQKPHPGQHLYHLDWHPNRLVLTELVQGESLTLGQQTVSRELGLNRFRETWSMVLADAFVNSTRLDPLHNAAVEQQMFDQLLGWLKTPSAEIYPELVHAEQIYRTTVSWNVVESAVERLRGALLELFRDYVTAPALIAAPPLFAQLQPLSSAVGAIPTVELETVTAPALHVSSTDIQTDGTPYIVSRNWLDADQRDSHQGSLRGFQRAQPTHLLYAGSAVRLVNELCVASADNDAQGRLLVRGLGQTELVFSLSADGVDVASNDHLLRLNGRDVGRSVSSLAAGDRIAIGTSGTELQLISVRD